MEIYKMGKKTYLVFKPTLSEEQVKREANKHFKTRISSLVAKRCSVVRDELFFYVKHGGTKCWAVWRAS